MSTHNSNLSAWRNLRLRNDQRELIIAALDYCHQQNIADGTVNSEQDQTLQALIEAFSVAMTVTLER